MPAIRLFHSKDAAALLLFVKTVFLEFDEEFAPETFDKDIFDVTKFYFERGGLFWVMVDGEKIIGSIGIVPLDNKILKLRRFYVDKEYRGQGLGKKLFQTVLTYCKKKSYKEVWLSTTPKLKAAERFYLNNGFQKSLKPLWPFKRAPFFYTLKLY